MKKTLALLFLVLAATVIAADSGLRGRINPDTQQFQLIENTNAPVAKGWRPFELTTKPAFNPDSQVLVQATPTFNGTNWTQVWVVRPTNAIESLALRDRADRSNIVASLGQLRALATGTNSMTTAQNTSALRQLAAGLLELLKSQGVR